MTNCLFCQIINKEVKADIVYEDDKVIAFDDINPKAPVHILILPKKHIESADDILPKDKEYLLAMFLAAQKIAKNKRLPGYKLALNVGKAAGQLIEHLHMHFLGGQNIKSLV